MSHPPHCWLRFLRFLRYHLLGSQRLHRVALLDGDSAQPYPRLAAGLSVASAALALLFAPALRAADTPDSQPPPRYEFRPDHDRDGIGKVYLGREIAHVMGHRGADWLERPEREAEEHPAALVDALELKPGMVAADIGAGTGYFTWRIAQKVAPNGFVYAVDIQKEMLELLQKNMSSREIKNVKPILSTAEDVRLPDRSIDLALMVDVYHEFSHPYEVMTSICRALKPGGRVVFVEYRAEDPTVPIKRLHKMSEAQVRKEAAELPLRWLKTDNRLPRQHIIVFERTD